MICHIKVSQVSSFKPVTRRQPFICHTGNPAREMHILVTEGDGETADDTRERLKRLEPLAELCESCASRLPGIEEGNQ